MVPLHAMSIARKLKIPRVVFPVGAGVMSALGLLISPLAFEVARSRRIHVDDIDAAEFGATFAALEADASEFLRRADVAPKDIRIVRRLDMRYQGQGHEIEVTLPDGPGASPLFAELPELFAQAYEKAYSLRLEEPMEVVNWKIEAIGPAPSLGEGYSLTGAAGVGKAQKGTRMAYDPARGGLAAWPVYDRYALAPGMSVSGPALIEERESTAVVGAGDTVTVDSRYNLIAELAR
jgi:N-methylhydantoinase A